MRALFLKRNYVEKSKKSGKSMTILEVFELPRVKTDGSGEVTQGQSRQYFIMDPNHFDLGKNCKCGDIVDIKLEYNEQFDRGIPAEITVVEESPIKGIYQG